MLKFIQVSSGFITATKILNGTDDDVNVPDYVMKSSQMLAHYTDSTHCQALLLVAVLVKYSLMQNIIFTNDDQVTTLNIISTPITGFYTDR